MPLLPDVDDAQAFDNVLRRAGQWAAAIDQIQNEHGLDGSFTQSRDGSTVVFLSARHCIKLRPPLPGYVASHVRETAALACVSGRLSLPTPELLGQGELEGWSYFVSTRLPGRPLDAHWDDMPRDARVEVAAELGRVIRELHGIDSEPLQAVTDPWPEFRRSQRGRCLGLERSKGLDPAWLAQLESFLECVQLVEPATTTALLHTEIGPGHVLVDQGKITGLIDFGDATVGDPEYDLTPVGMFVTRGDRAAFGAFCRAYGVDEAALAEPTRAGRLLHHAVLHRYGTLAWYLDTLKPPGRTLDDLADHWFGVDGQG